MACVPATTGACCSASNTCEVLPQDECTGIYKGPGSQCDPNPCFTTEQIGACCDEDDNCYPGLPEDDCLTGFPGASYGGDGSTCADDNSNNTPDVCE
jgi:hypothetical protein